MDNSLTFAQAPTIETDVALTKISFKQNNKIKIG